jgi:phosphoglucomutase
MTHERAGTLATPADLVDVAHLVTAYYTGVPDPDNLDQQVAFGTSGHRGSSLRTAFNETHILATTQAIVDYRRSRGLRRAAVPRSGHSRAVRAGLGFGAGGAGANDVTVLVDDRDGYTPTPGSRTRSCGPTGQDRRSRRPAGGIGLADGIVVTPSHNPPSTVGSSTTRHMAGRPTPMRPRSSRLRPTTTSGPGWPG